MPTTTSITTTYAGEFGRKYISAALLSGNTIQNGGVEVKPNVKYRETIKKVSTDDIVKDATCDFDATSTITLTERVLQPEEFQVNLQLCKQDFQSDWEAISMGLSAHDNLPPSFADFLVSHAVEKVAQKTENTIWGGVDANAGEFDGFTTLMAADADVIDATTTATSIDASNVVAELEKVLDAVPNAIYGKEDFSIYVPINVAKAYISAQAALGYMDRFHVGKTDLNFQGVPLFVANGMPADHMVAAEKNNLYFGTGLLSDHNEIKVIDLADYDGSQNVRVVMRFTSGVQYGIGSDIVLYTLA